MNELLLKAASDYRRMAAAFEHGLFQGDPRPVIVAAISALLMAWPLRADPEIELGIVAVETAIEMHDYALPRLVQGHPGLARFRGQYERGWWWAADLCDPA